MFAKKTKTKPVTGKYLFKLSFGVLIQPLGFELKQLGGSSLNKWKLQYLSTILVTDDMLNSFFHHLQVSAFKMEGCVDPILLHENK